MLKSVLLCALLSAFAYARNSYPDFLSGLKDEPTNELDGASVSRLISGPLEALGEISCQMDVKITKQVIGKCVKLGQGSDACVAGSYVHPFHHDCIVGR